MNYKAVSESEQFKVYVKHTAELQRVQLKEATREEKIAFFVNIYNALVIHAFVTIGPPMNLWQRYKVRCFRSVYIFMWANGDPILQDTIVCFT